MHSGGNGNSGLCLHGRNHQAALKCKAAAEFPWEVPSQASYGKEKEARFGMGKHNPFFTIFRNKFELVQLLSMKWLVFPLSRN